MLTRALLFSLLLCLPAWGGTRNNPPWPDPVLPPATNLLWPEAPHKFMDRANSVRTATLAALIAADGVTTQKNLSRNAHELNPLARHLVNHGWKGQLAASAIGYGASVGLSYVFHRAGHHTLERLVLHVSIGVEAGMVTNNLLQSQAH